MGPRVATEPTAWLNTGPALTSQGHDAKVPRMSAENEVFEAAGLAVQRQGSHVESHSPDLL